MHTILNAFGQSIPGNYIPQRLAIGEDHQFGQARNRLQAQFGNLGFGFVFFFPY